MGIVTWIVLGAIAGFVANLIMRGHTGFIGTIILGILGGLVGGFLAGSVFHAADVTGLNLESVIVAVLGAMLVIFVARALSGRRSAI